MSETTTDGAIAPEPNTNPMPDAPDSAAQVENQAEATDAEPGDDAPEATDERKPNGVQKRIAEITREKHDALRQAAAAKAEADAYKAMLDRLNGGSAEPQHQTPAQPAGKPTLDQFDTYEDFAEALADWKVEQKLAERDAARQAKEVAATFEQRAAALRDKMPDFDAVVTAPDLPITPDMADAIKAFENGPEVAYHLGTNKAEAARIAGLPSVLRLAEMGRLAERLTAKTNAAPTKAPPPPPPKTVNGLSAGATKSPDQMSLREYEEWRRNGGGR